MGRCGADFFGTGGEGTTDGNDAERVRASGEVDIYFSVAESDPGAIFFNALVAAVMIL